MNYEKVLVLGGTGFLGKNLQQVKPEWIYAGRTCFVQDGIECEYYPIYEVKYENYLEIKELIEFFDPDAVINLAADVGGIEYNEKNQLQIFENNILINTNIIRACRELEIDRVLSCLSTCAWPAKQTVPMTESDFWFCQSSNMVHPFDGHLGYGWSKRMLHLHTCLAREAGYNYSTFAPSNLYGPFDHFGEDSSHFVAALLHKVCKLKPYDNLELLGTGIPIRQFLYAPDLANIIPDLLEKHNSEIPLVIAPYEELMIDEMAKIALEIVNKDNYINYSNQSDGQSSKTCYPKQFSTIFPEVKFTSFKDGFKKTYEWYKENL